MAVPASRSMADSPVVSGGDATAVRAERSFSFRRWLIRFGLRSVVNLHLWALQLLAWRKPRAGAGDSRPKSILLTGTFYSENWIMNHLRPLAASTGCREVTIVCTHPIPPTPKVRWVVPPGGLQRLIGETPARLLTFAWLAFRHRPQVIGGFHLLINGLLAGVLARIVGARSLYFCGGGHREVLGGGYLGNAMFGALGEPDLVIERQLLRAVSHLDLCVCMGRRSVEFLRARGVRTRFETIPGGIDHSRFTAGASVREFDLIFVGRLVQVKRVDIFLDAIDQARQQVPGIRAVIVGVGELEQPLREQCSRLDLDDVVHFAGFQSDVASWLQRARVFVLPSDSEGLSLALMEAMSCGLPGIVSDVGELGELIDHGRNGFLVSSRSPRDFADRMVDLLTDQPRLAAFSQAAWAAAAQFEIGSTTEQWDAIFLET